MSGVPLEADIGHAFSSGASGAHREEGVTLLSAPAPVSFTARQCYGATGMWATLEEPACREVARFTSKEMAASYALALNRWLDARPSAVSPFFIPEMADDYRASWERLQDILARSLRPETTYEPQVQA